MSDGCGIKSGILLRRFEVDITRKWNYKKMMQSKYGKLAKRAHLLSGERQHFDSTELKMEKKDVPSAARLSAGSVLLLADDTTRRLASIVLTRGNYQVETADTLGKALIMIAQKKYDVMLVSENLVDGSAGIDAVKPIRSVGSSEDHVILFGIVNHADDQEICIFQESGMDGVIFKGSQLVSALESGLSKIKESPHQFVVIRS